MEYPQWSHEFPTCEDVIFVYNLHYFEKYFDKSWGQLNHCLFIYVLFYVLKPLCHVKLVESYVQNPLISHSHWKYGL